MTEFTKEKIMELCLKEVMDIRVTKRDDDNRFMGTPNIELEFDKDTLDPRIIVGGESIQLRRKKDKPSLCERCLQYWHPKKFCRKKECKIVGVLCL